MKPDFLCIGAQKAATTWLYGQMGRHPNIWVPPIKELNYFNNPSSTLYKRLFSKHWLDKDWRILFKQKILSPLSRGKIGRIRHFRWYFKYFFLPRSFRWYISLFPDDPGKITGEFSVAYAVLGDRVISQISNKLPDLKIIYLLRNPILRTWSQLKMNLGRYKGLNLDELPEEEFYKYFNNPVVKSHSDYLSTLGTFRKYFSSKQIFIGFFDEIIEDPMNFLGKLFNFLNVDFSQKIYSKGSRKKSNVGIAKEIPVKYLTCLSKMYYQQIIRIHQSFNNAYTKEWVEFTKKYLKEKQLRR